MAEVVNAIGRSGDRNKNKGRDSDKDKAERHTGEQMSAASSSESRQ